MSDTTLTLDEIFEEVGLAAKWEARAEERKAIAIAQNMMADGEPVEKITRYTGLTHEEVENLRDTN